MAHLQIEVTKVPQKRRIFMNAIWLDIIVIFLTLIRVALPILLLLTLGSLMERRRKTGEFPDRSAPVL
jgi:hypothetical protein